MTLGELKKHIMDLPEGSKLDCKLSYPFSWGGSYDEVAFRLDWEDCTREDVLENIVAALTNTFEGYGGGNYTYDEHTSVNFEDDTSSDTDGDYVREQIESIEGSGGYQTEEQKLISLIYNQ
tara:strand:+ start:4893 stop:5255 length:363 start_codon:yes stop_codon:yes gene_type:complete